MKKSSLIQLKKEGRGQSLVELAISLMVILYLLMGAVEFSLALFQYVAMRDAAQEGALYGSINPTDTSGITNRAIAAANDVVQLSTGNVAVSTVGASCEGLTNSTPNAVQVVITYPHEIFLPLVAPMIGSDTINLRASVTNTILSPSCTP